MCNVMSSHDCTWVKGRSFGQAGKTRDCLILVIEENLWMSYVLFINGSCRAVVLLTHFLLSYTSLVLYNPPTVKNTRQYWIYLRILKVILSKVLFDIGFDLWRLFSTSWITISADFYICKSFFIRLCAKLIRNC